MKATLRIPAENGYKDIEVDITEEELAKLTEPLKSQKPTGYERTNQGKNYWLDNFDGEVTCDGDYHTSDSNAAYTTANYYTSEKVAINNSRADQLMRQLRRFAVEHRKLDINWNDQAQLKWHISFNYADHNLYTGSAWIYRVSSVIYFDSKETAQAAIEAFYDELIWYFTEYRDSDQNA